MDTDLLPAQALRPDPDWPTQWCELLELTLAGCPDDALKAFRKSVIGRGKPLRAKQADNAIRGARAAQTAPKALGAGVSPEHHTTRDVRASWYIDRGWVLIQVRRYGTEWSENQVKLQNRAHWRFGEQGLSLLEYDDTGVDRLPIPTRFDK